MDATAICESVEDRNGSWVFTFRYDSVHAPLLVDKGSVTINGVSLTVIDPSTDHFSVAIIPYTFENTNFRTLQKGDMVNIEFDIIGKYVVRYLEMTKGR